MPLALNHNEPQIGMGFREFMGLLSPARNEEMNEKKGMERKKDEMGFYNSVSTQNVIA
jgi:hypothetical protein